MDDAFGRRVTKLGALADPVRETAASGEARRHLGDLDLRERVLGQRRAEDAAVLGVADRRLQRRAHHAERAARGLNAAADHAGHRQVEALAEPAFAADDVGVGNEEILESQVERMHAAVTDRRDRAAVQPAAAVLNDAELVAVERRLFHQQQAQAAVAERLVRVGARHDHQQAGFAGKGAPGLRAVEQPAARRTCALQ